MVFFQGWFGAITHDLVRPAQPVLGAGRRQRAPLFQGGSWRKDGRETRDGARETRRGARARLAPLRKAHSEGLITEWRL